MVSQFWEEHRKGNYKRAVSQKSGTKTMDWKNTSIRIRRSHTGYKYISEPTRIHGQRIYRHS